MANDEDERGTKTAKVCNEGEVKSKRRGEKKWGNQESGTRAVTKVDGTKGDGVVGPTEGWEDGLEW